MSFRISAVAYLLSLALVLGGSKETDNNTDLNLYAQSAVLMDADTGRILYGKNENEILANASTTKILTCILALELGDMESYVSVSETAAKMPKVHLGMKDGQFFKLKDLLYSLMLESHNDSAVAIAEHIGGSVEKFAVLMNEKAKNLGCVNTYFITPNGLDAVAGEKFHSTTAVDLSKMMSYCVLQSPKKDEFLEICTKKSHTFSDYKKTEVGFEKNGRTYGVNNKNTFLSMMEGVLAGKTGFTNKAGYCYVAALHDDERTFVVSLLACGWPNNKHYKWEDTKKLFRYGMDNFVYENIVTDVQMPVLEVEGGIPYGLKQIPVYVSDNTEPLKMLLSKKDKIEVKVYLPLKVKAPVIKTQQLGKMEYLLNGEVVKTCKICAKAGVEEHTWFWSFAYIFKKWVIS